MEQKQRQEQEQLQVQGKQKQEQRQGQDQKVSIDALTKEMGETYAAIKVNAVPSVPCIDGIRFDFRCGVRIQIPHGAHRTYAVRIWDDNSGLLLANLTMKAGDVHQSGKLYFRRYCIRIWDATMPFTSTPLVEHHFSLKNRIVVIRIPVDTIGDTLAWFPAVDYFQREHDCKLLVSVAKHMRALLESAYPNMMFIDDADVMNINAYAQYQIGVELSGEGVQSPYDWRIHPLTYVSYHILGLDPGQYNFGNTPPKLSYDASKRLIKEPYVCIGTMASGGCKLWLEPRGWDMVIDFLKDAGYRVVCIDGDRMTGTGHAYHRIPAEAEDCTGKGVGKSLADRASMIHHADFFVGVGSGLSWLSWAVGKPTVLISGFSKPLCEFYTPYRVANPHVCVGCFNDQRHTFDNHDNFFCPLHKGTKKQLICSLTITPEQVIGQIVKIPEFVKHLEETGRKVIFDTKVHSGRSAKYIQTTYPFEYRVEERGQEREQVRSQTQQQPQGQPQWQPQEGGRVDDGELSESTSQAPAKPVAEAQATQSNSSSSSNSGAKLITLQV